MLKPAPAVISLSCCTTSLLLHLFVLHDTTQEGHSPLNFNFNQQTKTQERGNPKAAGPSQLVHKHEHITAVSLNVFTENKEFT